MDLEDYSLCYLKTNFPFPTLIPYSFRPKPCPLSISNAPSSLHVQTGGGPLLPSLCFHRSGPERGRYAKGHFLVSRTPARPSNRRYEDARSPRPLEGHDARTNHVPRDGPDARGMRGLGSPGARCERIRVGLLSHLGGAGGRAGRRSPRILLLRGPVLPDYASCDVCADGLGRIV